jgi:hypothetical protein
MARPAGCGDGSELMKWWKVLLGVTILAAVAVVLAGKSDVLRVRRMHDM